MTNVNAAAEQILPLGGADNSGWKLGYIDSAAKAAQNDTVTVTNADEVQVLSCVHDATGAFETHTVSGAVITLTSATTGAKSALIRYR